MVESTIDKVLVTLYIGVRSKHEEPKAKWNVGERAFKEPQILTARSHDETNMNRADSFLTT